MILVETLSKNIFSKQEIIEQYFLIMQITVEI